MNVAKEQSEMDGEEGERERSEAPVSRRLGPAGPVDPPLCVRASPSRYCATRHTRCGGRGRGHRVGAERDYRCKSPRTKGSLLVPL